MADYQQQLRWSKMRVGIIVTTALLILFFTILFVGKLENLFSPRITIYAAFADVKGLRPGAPVWFTGVNIGSVKSLAFKRGNIIAKLGIDRNALSYIKQDSQAYILTLGLLGDKYIDVTPGSKSAKNLLPGETIKGQTRSELNEELSLLISKIGSKQGTIGRLFEEDTVYRDLEAAVHDLRLFAKALKPSEGTMNKLIEDKSLYDNVNTVAIKLNILLDKINNEEGTVGSLVSNKELKNEMQTTLKEVNALVKDLKENPKKYFSFSVF